MASIDVKQIIFDLAEHEKQLYYLGDFTEEDEQWFNEELGFDNGFESEDVFLLGIEEISELISDFIDYYVNPKDE